MTVQLMSEKLTMVSEQNNAPQNLSQLYLLLFLLSYQFDVFVTEIFTTSSL